MRVGIDTFSEPLMEFEKTYFLPEAVKLCKASDHAYNCVGWLIIFKDLLNERVAKRASNPHDLTLEC